MQMNAKLTEKSKGKTTKAVVLILMASKVVFTLVTHGYFGVNSTFYALHKNGNNSPII